VFASGFLKSSLVAVLTLKFEENPSGKQHFSIAKQKLTFKIEVLFHIFSEINFEDLVHLSLDIWCQVLFLIIKASLFFLALS
jgi:hypothetical protein